MDSRDETGSHGRMNHHDVADFHVVAGTNVVKDFHDDPDRHHFGNAADCFDEMSCQNGGDLRVVLTKGLDVGRACDKDDTSFLTLLFFFIH
ncbi:hypothetical protein AA0X95_06600 [Bacillus sp. 1P10SD]|uniref:hypothetical protein n=1 Tax=Bacillus sp. 1P10SD TaxID=3132265 RepID=UPI0039A64354